MKFLAVIPARGGSKSIPNKNIKTLAGKPLIAWTIECALSSKYLNKIVVSSNDKGIIKLAKKYGAEAPFERPEELATDSIGIEPTLKHAYEYYLNKLKFKADAVLYLPPTSPLRQDYHIDEAIEIFMKTGADSVVSVNETPANHTPYWTLTRQKNNKVTLWGGKHLKNILTRRQDFPMKCYARNDLVYILKPKNLYEKKMNLYGNHVELYDVPHASKYELDINTPDEWIEAEIRIARMKKKGYI